MSSDDGDNLFGQDGGSYYRDDARQNAWTRMNYGNTPGNRMQALEAMDEEGDSQINDSDLQHSGFADQYLQDEMHGGASGSGPMMSQDTNEFMVQDSIENMNHHRYSGASNVLLESLNQDAPGVRNGPSRLDAIQRELRENDAEQLEHERSNRTDESIVLNLPTDVQRRESLFTNMRHQ